MSNKEEILEEFDNVLVDFDIFLDSIPIAFPGRYERNLIMPKLSNQLDSQLQKMKMQALSVLKKIDTTDDMYLRCIQDLKNLGSSRFNIEQVQEQLKNVYTAYATDTLSNQSNVNQYELLNMPATLSEADAIIKSAHITGRYSIISAIFGAIIGSMMTLGIQFATGLWVTDILPISPPTQAVTVSPESTSESTENLDMIPSIIMTDEPE